jgi:hypothetical protein
VLCVCVRACVCVSDANERHPASLWRLQKMFMPKMVQLVSQARGVCVCVYVYDSWLACIMSLDCQDHFNSSDVIS